VVAFFFQLKQADGHCRKREPTAYLRTIVTGYIRDHAAKQEEPLDAMMADDLDSYSANLPQMEVEDGYSLFAKSDYQRDGLICTHLHMRKPSHTIMPHAVTATDLHVYADMVSSLHIATFCASLVLPCMQSASCDPC